MNDAWVAASAASSAQRHIVQCGEPSSKFVPKNLGWVGRLDWLASRPRTLLFLSPRAPTRTRCSNSRHNTAAIGGYVFTCNVPEKCDGILTSSTKRVILNLLHGSTQHAVIRNKETSWIINSRLAHSLLHIQYTIPKLGCTVKNFISFHRYRVKQCSGSQAPVNIFGFGYFQSNDFQKGDSGLPCPLALMYLHDYWGFACHTRDCGAHSHNGSESAPRKYVA